jgi:glutathione synthase/RimK-type ligase-like ATP-grasp enzyme
MNAVWTPRKGAAISRTVAAHEAPRQVAQRAAKTARPIGDGLYGVDLMQAGNRVVVIAVNDNPTIDCGWRTTWALIATT